MNLPYSAPVLHDLAEGSYAFTAYANNSFGVVNQTTVSFTIENEAQNAPFFPSAAVRLILSLAVPVAAYRLSR